MAEPSLIPFSPTDQEALADLCRLLQFAEGEFALIVAVCNTSRHRQRVVAQLQQQCPVTLAEHTLDPATTALFTPLRDRVIDSMGASTGDDPADAPLSALLVYDLEGVRELDQVLTATNQIREEFRQLLCPVVLWLSDDSLKRLMRTAPDFYTWASTVTFTPPPTDYADFLAEVVADVWEQIGRSRENRFLSNTELGLTPGSPRCQELDRALRELATQQVSLPPAQVAALDLVQGRIADNNTPQARELYERSLAGWQALIDQEPGPAPVDEVALEADPAVPAPPDLAHPRIGRGYAQFYLGLWWGNHAARHPSESAAAYPVARDYFAAAIATFTQAERSDLVAKYINYWALVLHRLEVWDELEAVATQAMALHERQAKSFRLARAQGFLAEVALTRQDWGEAHRLATAALALIQPLATATTTPEGAEFYAWINSFHRSWYLFSLGKAQQGQGDLDPAIATLKQALAVTRPHDDPKLYSTVLGHLRHCQYQQGSYLEAFRAYKRRVAIDNRFNLAPFVGAGRLQPKRRVANPALPTPAAAFPAEGLELEAQDLIAASGRRGDVDRLLARLARDEFKLTIVHGPSGVGKSSLLEAGLVPVLRQQRFEGRRGLPIYLRYYTNWAADLLKGLGAELPAEGAGASPNLVLTALRQHTQHNRMVVLIFDQFEEFFFEYAQPALRREFYGLLQRCLAMPFVKVVLSLREDYIHYLLDCNRHMALDIIGDDILAQRWLYYLGNFAPADAAEVVQDLLAPTPCELHPELVEQMVADLAAELEAVRPIELQIVGAQVVREGMTTLTAYEQLGADAAERLQRLVQGYLDGLVAHCGPPEPHQQLANVVLFCLTNEQGTRPLRTAAELAQELLKLTDAQQLDGAVFALVLNILDESGLVQRVEAQPEPKYQLVHDYLAAFIRSSRQPVMAALARERGRREAAEQQQAETERRRLRQAQRALVGLGIVTAVAVGAGLFAWQQRQFAWQQQRIAARGERNAQLVAESLAIEKFLEGGLDRNAVIQAVRTGQTLLDTPADQLEGDTRLRAISSIREAVYEARERERLLGHTDNVNSVAFSPDGTTLATASEDGTVKLWTTDGVKLHTLNGHTDAVLSVAFSPDGTTLATASANAVKLWTTEGEELQTLNGPAYRVSDVTYSPDGTILATASANAIKLWTAEGEELRTLNGHTRDVNSVAFSPDGTTLASASDDGTVKLWSTEGEELRTLNGHTDSVNSVAFSPDGTTLASTSWDNTVKLWSTEGEELRTLNGHTNLVNSVAFSPDSTTIASASEDGTVKLWSTEGGELQTLNGHANPVFSVVFSPDGSTLASASADDTVKLWTTEGEEPHTPTPFTNPARWVWSVAFSPDGTTFATANGDNTVKLWTTEGEELQTLNGHTNPVFSVAYSPDGSTLASASSDNTVKLWSAEGEELQTLNGHTNSVFSVAYSPDGSTLATASADNTVKLWSTDGEELQTLNGHTARVRSVAYSPDGTTLATASADNTVKLWSVDGEELQTLNGHTDSVWSVAYSPDGTTLATASADNTVKLWSANGEELQTLNGHTNSVWSVAYSPDGTTLASASADNTVKLWSADGEELQTLNGHADSVLSVAYSPDGSTLASASWDNTVKLWNFTLADLMARGCDWLGTYFVRQIPQVLMELEVCQQNDPAITVAAVPELVRQGKQLARSGNQQGAIELFQQAIDWDSTLDLDPQTLAQNLATAHTQTTKAEALARDGNLADAIEQFQAAQALDRENPALDFNPETRANAIYSEALQIAARELAREGQIAAAAEKFAAAQALNPENPDLDFDPETWANEIYSEVLQTEARTLARNGQLDQAAEKFAAAQAINADLNFDPETRVKEVVRAGYVSRGESLARNGDIDAALEAYRQAEAIELDNSISAQRWGTLCWYGSLSNQAEKVIFACDNAVALDPENGGIIGSRGLARALTGDTAGAITDFKVFITWTRSEAEKAQRQAWIDALEQGENPFTPEVLADLR